MHDRVVNSIVDELCVRELISKRVHPIRGWIRMLIHVLRLHVGADISRLGEIVVHI